MNPRTISHHRTTDHRRWTAMACGLWLLVFYVALLEGGFGPRGAWAEESGLLEAPEGIALAPLLIRTVLSLGLVAMLIYGTVFALRRVVGRRGHPGRGAPIRVLGSAFLGPKKGVYLLDVLDRILVVGVTDTHMVLLSEITDPAVVQSVAHVETVQRDETFLAHLRSFMSPRLRRLRKTDGA